VFLHKKLVLSLKYQIETATGSAGEQPVRDIFDLYGIIAEKDCYIQSFFAIMLVIYALKNPSINFILRVLDNPL
jgi:hypothetical protein